MNFAEFASVREQLLRENPGLRDAAATNLYAALARLIPPPTAAPAQKIHRCHFASEWTERFGLPAENPRAR